MSSVESQLASIKARQRELEIQQQRYLAEIEVRKKQIDEASSVLRDQGFESVERAKERIVSLETEVQEKLEEVMRLLG